MRFHKGSALTGTIQLKNALSPIDTRSGEPNVNRPKRWIESPIGERFENVIQELPLPRERAGGSARNNEPPVYPHPELSCKNPF